MNQKIRLGRLKTDAGTFADGEVVYLEKHRWDCDQSGGCRTSGWDSLSPLEKTGEVLAGLSVFLVPILILFIGTALQP